jgi:hypothetical protein
MVLVLLSINLKSTEAKLFPLAEVTAFLPVKFSPDGHLERSNRDASM